MSVFTLRPRAALVVCATALALLSSGCSLLPGPGASRTASSPSSAAASEGASDSDSTPATPEKTEKTERPKKEAAPGTQIVTAPSSQLSFAVPADWLPLYGDSTALVDFNQLAEQTGISEDTLRSQMELIDLYVVRIDSQATFTDNIAVIKQTFPASTPVSEAVMRLALANQPGVTTGEYSTEEVADGKAHLLSYTSKDKDVEVNGLLLTVPTESGEYAQMAITTGEKSTQDSLKETILSSLR